MTTLARWITTVTLIIIVVAVGIFAVMKYGIDMPPLGTPPAATSTQTYGMSEYVDSAYGFSFWYPGALSVTASTTLDAISFPGGIAVEVLQVGAGGGVSVVVVNSASSTITDEPSPHGSPIAQTKYFYDSASAKWMTAFPDSASEGSVRATTTANVSKTTMAGLPMLASGKRFNTTIIPLSTTRFLVVTDGGGSSFTEALAKTVAQTGVAVDPSARASALLGESAAYSN